MSLQPAEAATKRSCVAEAIERLLAGGERQGALELSVVSVEGFEPSDDEWAEVHTLYIGR